MLIDAAAAYAIRGHAAFYRRHYALLRYAAFARWLRYASHVVYDAQQCARIRSCLRYAERYVADALHFSMRRRLLSARLSV